MCETMNIAEEVEPEMRAHPGGEIARLDDERCRGEGEGGDADEHRRAHRGAEVVAVQWSAVKSGPGNTAQMSGLLKRAASD